MYYNWNRISMLSAKAKISTSEAEEISIRTNFQTAFASAKTDDEAHSIAADIEKTITDDLMRKVDAFMK